mgnify:FL=1
MNKAKDRILRVFKWSVLRNNQKFYCFLFVEHLIIQLSRFVTSISSEEYLCLVFAIWHIYNIEAVFLRAFSFLGVWWMACKCNQPGISPLWFIPSFVLCSCRNTSEWSQRTYWSLKNYSKIRFYHEKFSWRVFHLARVDNLWNDRCNLL